MILSHDTTVFTTDPRVEVNFAILYRNSIKYFQLFFWLRNPIVVLSRFTFTRSLGSGNYASQGWGSRMVANMAVRWEHSVIGGSFEKIHQRSLSEYGKYRIRLLAKFHPSQANTTPRREAQILLEVEETQAEIVGPAELFLRYIVFYLHHKVLLPHPIQ